MTYCDAELDKPLYEVLADIHGVGRDGRTIGAVPGILDGRKLMAKLGDLRL